MLCELRAEKMIIDTAKENLSPHPQPFSPLGRRGLLDLSLRWDDEVVG